MERGMVESLLRKTVVIEFDDPIDGLIIKKGILTAVDDSAISMLVFGKTQLYSLDRIIKAREVMG